MKARRRRSLARSLPPRATGPVFSDAADTSAELAGATAVTVAATAPRESSMFRLLSLASATEHQSRRGMGPPSGPMQTSPRALGRRSATKFPVTAAAGVNLGGRRSSVAVYRPAAAIRLPGPLQTPLFPRGLTRLDRRSKPCVSRFVRRGVLFARRVAGRGRRLSPGSGGRYRRVVTSSHSCR